MDSRDLIHALRLWLPDGKSVAGVRQDLAPKLDAAFAEFAQTVPGSGISDAAEIMPLAATAAGRGLLQEAVQSAKDEPAAELSSEPLKSTLSELSWSDLLLAAACAHKNDAANRTLLEVIENEVLPPLAKKWGRDRAAEVTDELPQKLHLFDQRGLNRGRPRLLAYGGRARLVTWLRSVAHRDAIDRWRGESEQSLSPEQPDGASGETSDASEQMVRGEDLDLARRVGPQAFEQLMRQLPEISEQQYRFAYFRVVGGLDNIEIADRLGVAKSRVTELSQQVFRRIVGIMRRLAPELAEMSDDPTKDRRHNMEAALQEWFGVGDAGSANVLAFDQPAPRASGGNS